MQAARGASLNTSDTNESARPSRRTLFAVVAALGFVIDQTTKQWALGALDDGPIGVIGDWFQLRLVFNPGAAFSTGTEYTIVFTCIAMVAAVAVLVVSRRLRSPLWAVGMGVLLAGVLGNLFDRIFREPQAFHGHVVDFLSFGSFPVFNVADMCINVAAAVIILQAFRGVRLDGTLERDDAGASGPARNAEPAPDTAANDAESSADQEDRA